MFDDINGKQSIFLKRVLLGSMGAGIAATLYLIFGPTFGPTFGGAYGEGNILLGFFTLGGAITAGVFYCILRYKELEYDN